MSRARHLAEMRYAVAHRCSLAQARAAFISLRQRAADEARAKAAEGESRSAQGEVGGEARRRLHYGYDD